MGDIDKINFDAKPDRPCGFDLNAKSLGSKANAVLTLSDSKAKFWRRTMIFDGSDPFLAYTFAAGGQYSIRLTS